MELSIGSRIYLKRDFIKQFELDSKTSQSFQIIALTDVAVALRNIRTNRTYTLSLAKIADNIDPVVKSVMPKGRVTLSVKAAPIQPEDNTPLPEDNNDIPLEVFTHIAPIPTGRLKINRVNAITQIDSGDDPFSDLYT